MPNLQVAETRAVARPLKVLSPLIKKDFEAAKAAGQPFEKAAGEKLIEAEDGHFEDNTPAFYRWAEREFGKSRTSIDTCMAFAGARGGKSFKTKHETKYAPKKHGGQGWVKPLARDWIAPVDAIADKARDEQRRLIASDHVSRQQERDAKLKLKLRIIDIGYKVLARELHPDKVGGSREAMARLNEARDELKANA